MQWISQQNLSWDTFCVDNKIFFLNRSWLSSITTWNSPPWMSLSYHQRLLSFIYCSLTKSLIIKCGQYIWSFLTRTQTQSFCMFGLWVEVRRVQRVFSLLLSEPSACDWHFTAFPPWSFLLFRCGKGHIYHEWIDLFKMHQTIKPLKPCQEQDFLKKSTSWSTGFTCRNIFFPEFNLNEVYAIWPAYPIFLFWALIHALGSFFS